MPVYHPPSAPAPAATSAGSVTLPQLVVTARPRRLRVHVRTRVLFLVTSDQAGKLRPVAHASVRIAGQTVTADAAGRVVIVLHPRGRASGAWRAVASAPGYRPGQVDLHPVARRRHRAIAG